MGPQFFPVKKQRTFLAKMMGMLELGKEPEAHVYESFFAYLVINETEAIEWSVCAEKNITLVVTVLYRITLIVT